MVKQSLIVPVKDIEHRIFLIRGHRAMIDRDLAELYGVETKYLNRQVKRNRERFPEEFMFQLTKSEKEELVTNWHRFESLKHSTTFPMAFTEHGVAMLASVLHSERAIAMSILIIKAFVRLREILSTHKVLAQKLQILEMKVGKHDQEIAAIIEVIRKLMEPPSKQTREIGFKVKEPAAAYRTNRRRA